MIKKICLGCKKLLPLSDFYLCNKNKDGKTGRCGKCLKDKITNNNLENKTVTNEQKKAFDKF